MEIAGGVTGGVAGAVCQCMTTPITDSWRRYRDIMVNMNTLKHRRDELQSKKTTIEKRMDIEVIEGRTELKPDVNNWLKKAGMMIKVVEDIEQVVDKVRCLTRVSLGKTIILKINELNEWSTKCDFPDSLVIRLPQAAIKLPTTKLAGKTSKRKLEETLALVIDSTVAQVGVCGMAGIGKTTIMEHINNRLLEMKDKFDNVIWVRASKASQITLLQDEIASALNLDISSYHDKESRATELHNTFLTRKRFVLILDDLWKAYDLKEIGIPEPTSENGCKLVLTTRSVNVCSGMSCQSVSMELLLEHEAMELFKDIVGLDVINSELEDIMKGIVQECRRLPLAIVTTGKSLKKGPSRNALKLKLEDLKDYKKGFDKAQKSLKVSYDSLTSELQNCLLYCALFPADHPIEKNMLIEYLIAEEVVEERKNRESEFLKGLVMLESLVNASLLNETADEHRKECVMMHGLVRKMALQIARESPRYLVKAGEKLELVEGEELWKKDLQKISLMFNDIKEIPPNFRSPNCTSLSTLLLSENHKLSFISDNFFDHMELLKILDLSNTSIEKLPVSLSDLLNLTTLLLRQCYNLKFVPCLAKLTVMRKLDFYGSGITELPQGMGLLVGLRFLNFDRTGLQGIPDGILSKLVNLQYLSFNRKLGVKVKGEEIALLRKLETFEGVFFDINSFNAYVNSLNKKGPTTYILQLGSASTPSWFATWESKKVVCLTNFDMRVVFEQCSLLLPEDVNLLAIDSCRMNVQNLCELTLLEKTTKLRYCSVKNCDWIDHLFAYSSNIFGFLRDIQNLHLEELQGLRNLILRQEISGVSIPLPSGIFSSLKEIRVVACNSIKKLFPVVSLPNLEEMVLAQCTQLEEIISATTDNEAKAIKSLPKLKKLHLKELPKLQSIGNSKKHVDGADSLQQIEIRGCPRLKGILLLDTEQCPPLLKQISVEQNWWNLLQWNHPNAKENLQSFLRFV